MNTSRSIIGILVIAGTIALAIVLGVSLVTSQFQTLAWVVGSAIMLTCMLLGKRIWIILPFLGALSLTFRIPGQPTTLLIAQMLFLGFSVLLLLIRKLPIKVKIGELEWWVIAIVLMVGQVYLRNPTGLNITGGETVGGRPYILFAIAAMVYFFLSSYLIPARDLIWYMWLSIIGSVLNFGLMVFGRFFPMIGFWYGAITGFESETVDPERAGRVGYLGNAAKNMSVWLVAFVSPLKAIVKPIWLPFLLLTLAFAAMSGFRNAIAFVGITYCVGLLYRGGFLHLAATGLLGSLAVVLLAVANMAYPLPPNAQRALSFLPGTWEDHIRRDAEHSTDWRWEVWEEVLMTDRWISNKWLGDGLGFTRQELQAQMALMEASRGYVGLSGFDIHRESILASGDYHSGPIQTIRTIGYVGLVVLLLAMFRLAVHAHWLMRIYRHTSWFPLVLFIGIPCIVNPLFFIFIFGTFQSGSIAFLSSAAMIRILQRNLPPPENRLSVAA